ncbi:hypothetical protein U27_03061 [Candidatus Vecturithrix granuli]|uniref:RDD domain-containing protein n=1 Tax=Vecturithrix granuli TaxID=1499967 RepID=A0A081BUU4_VECG1|nr:hypothetical protein U27_03061 [Candidatus Vecturithrix granuli]
MGALMESRAGFGLRLTASLIDLVLIILGGIVIGSVFGAVLGGIFGGMLASFESLRGFWGGVLGSLIGISVFGTLYNLLEGLFGATIGKMLIGLKIGDADGTKAGIGKLFFRYLLKNITFVCSLLAGILGIAILTKIGAVLGLIWFLGCFLVLSRTRQGLHDMIAGTAVYPRKVLR